MTTDAGRATRLASLSDAAAVAALLDAFAGEFGDPTPGTAALAKHVATAIDRGDVLALLAGEPAVGVALVSFRASVWTGAPTATLDDLYVDPAHRGRGLGRALLRAALDLARRRGAATFELYTGEGDTAARRLYEAHGLTNTEPGETDRLLFYYRSV